MRPSGEPARKSLTPIYDALCAEYRRLFRALPGDRSGEDELRFEAFGRYGRYGRRYGGTFRPGDGAGPEPGPGTGRGAAGEGPPALPPGGGGVQGL